jgi:chromosome partitioning protein
MCQTSIPRNVRLAEAPSHGKPAIAYDPHSRGAEAYMSLAKEIMDRVSGSKSSEVAQSTADTH